ncbi:hypothetical protein [Salinispira pacifica]|uniref:Uncharacterized protein n=1 Tax=Salinispira pacifica TaxID=1307761 RepID=V5WJ13_9SPIO|nr:hypothetical protein [Salinispira pacifica]AHC15615.1 hypothetical protein L21SP2_2254 [Salinispira pacifica]
MSAKTGHFMGLLRVEFEDMMEDVSVLETLSKERLKNAEITDYVYNENNVVFEQEIQALRHLAGILEQPRWQQIENLDQLNLELRNSLKEAIVEKSYPPVVQDLVSRKLDKVRQFVLS